MLIYALLLYIREKETFYFKVKLINHLILFHIFTSIQFLYVIFMPFSCEEVNGIRHQVLHSDYSVECWNYEHNVWTFGVALPFGLLWGVFLPLFVYFRIYLRKSNIYKEDEIFKMKYGCLFCMYNESSIFW